MPISLRTALWGLPLTCAAGIAAGWFWSQHAPGRGTAQATLRGVTAAWLEQQLHDETVRGEAARQLQAGQAGSAHLGDAASEIIGRLPGSDSAETGGTWELDAAPHPAEAPFAGEFFVRQTESRETVVVQHVQADAQRAAFELQALLDVAISRARGLGSTRAGAARWQREIERLEAELASLPDADGAGRPADTAARASDERLRAMTASLEQVRLARLEMERQAARVTAILERGEDVRGGATLAQILIELPAGPVRDLVLQVEEFERKARDLVDQRREFAMLNRTYGRNHPRLKKLVSSMNAQAAADDSMLFGADSAGRLLWLVERLQDLLTERKALERDLEERFALVQQQAADEDARREEQTRLLAERKRLEQSLDTARRHLEEEKTRSEGAEPAIVVPAAPLKRFWIISAQQGLVLGGLLGAILPFPLVGRSRRGGFSRG